MKKISRKLLISVFTLAFALITLGATTFAWFTLSATVSVDEFELDVVAGTGIEISVDGKTYKNFITLADLKAAKSLAPDKSIFYTLDSITTKNGYQFYTLEHAKKLQANNNLDPAVPLASGWFELDLFFRSPESGTNVVLDSATKVSSTAKSWTSDANFLYRGSTPLSAGASPISIFAVDSLRFSFQEFAGTTPTGEGENIVHKFTEGTGKSTGVTIWELIGEGRDATNAGTDANFLLGTSLKVDNGLYKYWEAKGLLSELPSEYDHLPADVKVDDDKGEEVIISLTTAGDFGYTYGFLRARFWLEGFDPDNFDAQFGSKLKISLVFSVKED